MESWGLTKGTGLGFWKRCDDKEGRYSRERHWRVAAGTLKCRKEEGWWLAKGGKVARLETLGNEVGRRSLKR